MELCPAGQTPIFPISALAFEPRTHYRGMEGQYEGQQGDPFDEEFLHRWLAHRLQLHKKVQKKKIQVNVNIIAQLFALQRKSLFDPIFLSHVFSFNMHHSSYLP